MNYLTLQRGSSVAVAQVLRAATAIVGRPLMAATLGKNVYGGVVGRKMLEKHVKVTQ